MAKPYVDNHDRKPYVDNHGRKMGTRSPRAPKNKTNSNSSSDLIRRVEIASSLNKFLSIDDDDEKEEDFQGGSGGRRGRGGRSSSRKSSSRSSPSRRSGYTNAHANEYGGEDGNDNDNSVKSGRQRRSTAKRKGSRNGAVASSGPPAYDEDMGEMYGEYTLNDYDDHDAENSIESSYRDTPKSMRKSAKQLFDRAVRAASPSILRRARSKSPGASKIRSAMRLRQNDNDNDSPTNDGTHAKALTRGRSSPGRLRKKMAELDNSRGDDSPNSRRRAQSSGKLRKRTESPGRLKKSPESPGRLKKRTESPGKLKKRTVSPGRLKRRPDSTGKLKKRTESPGKLKKRTESPGKFKKRGESSGRLKKRTESPGKLKKRAVSPGRLAKSRRSTRRYESAASDENDDGLLAAMLERDAEAEPRKRRPRSVASAPVRRTTSTSGVQKSTSEEEPNDNNSSTPKRSYRTRNGETGLLEVENDNSDMQNDPMQYKLKRNKSLDPAMALAMQRVKLREKEDAQPESESTRPPLRRASSMLLAREMGRRGTQESLVELIQYSEDEIHSTSYFASNHVLINRERMKRGLRPLTRNIAMDELARKNADAMSKSTRPNPLGTTYVGNVLRGESIRSIHRSIMLQKQGRERANLLNPYFQDFGVGTSKGEDGQLYMCQLFSERLELALTDTLAQPRPQKEP